MADVRQVLFDLLARDRASGPIKGVGKTAETTSSKIKSNFKQAFSPTAMFAGLTGGGIALGAFGTTAVKEFASAQAAQARLSNAFAKFPQLAGQNTKELRGLNTELQRKTKFDDDATASAQAVLAGFGLTEDQLKTITPLLQDYASRTGKDLPTAAQDLGKAILGQGRALKGIGVNFKDTGTAAGNFAQLTDVLRAKVGGFASKEGNTAAGKMAILKNQFGELQESVGSQLLPVLVKLADFAANDLLPAITGISNWISNNKPLILALGAGITAALVPAFVAWAAAAIPAAAATVAAAAPVIALGAAVAGLALLVIKNWDTIKAAFSAAVDFIKGVIGGVVGFIQDHWQLLLAILAGPIALAVLAIKTHFDDIVGFITGLPARIGKAAAGMWDGIKNAFRSAINFIIRGWNKLEFKIPGFKVGRVHFGGFTLGVPDIKPLAKGGRFNAGDLLLTGELGPELVSFNRAGTITPNGHLGVRGPAWSGDLVINADGIKDEGVLAEYASRFVGWRLGLVGGL